MSSWSTNEERREAEIRGGSEGTTALIKDLHHVTDTALDILCILSNLIFTTILRKVTDEDSGV